MSEVMRYTLAVDTDVSSAIGGVKQLQSALNGVKLPTSFTTEMVKDFDKLKDSLSKFKALAEKSSFSKTDLKNLQKLQTEIDSTFTHLSNSINELNGKTFYLDADYTKIKEAGAEIDKIKSDIQNKLADIKIEFGSSSKGKVSLGLNEVINDMERGVKSSKVLSSAMKEVEQSISAGNFVKAGQQLTEVINKAGTLKGASAGLLDIFKKWGLTSFEGPVKDITDMEQRASKLGDAFALLLPYFAKDEAALQALSRAFNDATDKKKELEATGKQNAADFIDKQVASTEKLSTVTHQATQSQIEMSQATARAASEVQQLQQSTQYFFSLRNMINLLKRGLREAVQTIKDLDAAMTETAVVTRFSVSDMWAKLPDYTANANKLGATIQDMYESTTLYYQQGLNTQQSMAIASETMKMARIAGLEAKDATDMMTAALRGFNMELNETSATRINDVYSNLAAKTASDTEEIGKAMQRTASIAHSAGMSFEGTAAFLAQAVETTREPAENIGTAMKTIIARFQEMKKNPLEISEVEGEEVSFNKVDAALQSIGVSLKDTNGQFRELDQVFLDISQKWDSLSQTQQRYIATIAAGSRQQSRFIAMMGDYDRTVELMNYANNSSGASSEQFGKTLESLEAKINKFKNAWQQFLMGILNDTWTKRLVDGGTMVLNTVNSIINALSFNGKLSLVKSALSIFTAFNGLKLTGRFANKMIGGLGGLVDPTSTFGLGFKNGGIKSSGNQAKAISDPIVQAVNRIYNVLNKNATPQENLRSGSFQDFKNNQRAFQQTVKQKGTIGQAFGSFKGLDKKQIATILNNNVGMERQLQRTFAGYVNNLPIDDYTKKLVSKSIPSMFKAFKNDPRMSGDQFLKAFRLDQLGKTLIAGGEVQAGKDLLKTYLQSRRGAAEKERNDWLTRNNLTAEQHHKKLKEDKQYRDNYRSYRNNPVSRETIADPKLLDKIAQGAGAVGAAFGTAGMAVSSFGMALSNCGLETVGGILTSVGAGISNVGSVISSVAMTISVAMEAGSAAIMGFLSTAWPFALAIAAIVGAVVLLDKAIVTNKEALKAAADAATAASEAYDAAKQSASELADAIEQIKATQASFDGLVAGTAEFNDQLITANKQILDLVDKYPMLMEPGKDYVTTDKNGLMHISDEGIKAVEEYQKTLQSRASAVDLIQTSDLNLLEGQQQAEELRKRNLKMSDEEYARNQRDADLLEQRVQTQQEMARLNAIQTVLTGKNIKDNQKLATIFADQYEAQRKSVEASMTTDKHAIRQQYADYHGYTYERSSGKIKDQNDNEVNFEDSVIKDEMIEATVLLNFEADAESLNNTLDRIDSIFTSSLEDTFAGSSDFITDVLTKNIDTDEDLLKEVLTDKQHFQDLVNKLSSEQIAAILGTNAADITDANIEQYKSEVINKLTQNSQDIADAQVDAYANLGSMLARAQGYTIDELNKTMLINGRHQKINMDEINQYMKQFTAEQVHSLANIGELLEKNAGPDAMKEYIGHMTDIYAKINKSKFGNIDLKNREPWFNADGSVSTVSGTSGEFGANGKIGIAFTPYLQTGTGTPKKLTKKEYNKYLEEIVEEAKGDADKILQLDKERYNIVAEVSSDATKDKHYQETARTMHDLEDLRLSAKEVQGVFEKADLTSAMGQLKAYTELANGSYEATRELGEGLISLPSSANLVGRAFDEFVEGGEWAEIAENIDKIQNSFGQIDAAGIMSVAKESNQLNTLLDSGIVSAGGLAMALQGVADGKLAIGDVNQTVLELLSSLTRVEDEALKAHDIITNFDAGIDYGEAEDFAKENAKKVQELWDNEEYGNPQLQNYIKLAAGEERWNKALKESGGDLEVAEKKLKKYVTTFSDGFSPVIDQLVSGMSVGGKSLADNIKAFEKIDPELAKKFAKIDPRIEGENFYFAAAGETATDLTTDEFKTYLEKIYGVSTEYADLIFEYFANMSPDFKQELTKNDFAETVQSEDFKETHYNAETGQYVFSDAEMQAYALARGLETVGEAYADIAPLLNTTVKDLEKAQMNWLDQNGQRWELSGEKANSAVLDNYLKNYFDNVDISSFLSNAAYNDNGVIELGNVIADAVARGADEYQGAQIAWETAQQYGGEGEFYYEGQLVKLEDFANFDEFYEHLHELQETSQWVDIGYAIAQGMEKYQYNKDHPDENVPESTASDKTANKTEDDYTYKPSLSATDTGEAGRDLTWRDKVPGWVVPIVEKIGESAEKQAEIQEAYQNVQGQNAEDLEQSNREFWSGLGDFLNTSLNDKTGYTSETEPTYTEQTGDNLNTGSESLVEATNQLAAGLTSLGTAGESLNEAGNSLNNAAQNLTNVAAVLFTSGDSNTPTQAAPGMPSNIPPNQQSSASGIIVVDNSPAMASFEEVEGKANETKETIEAGATFNVRVRDSKLSKVAKQAKAITKASGDKSINVTATASGEDETKSLTTAVKDFKGLGRRASINLHVGVSGLTDVRSAITAVNNFYDLRDDTVTLTTKHKKEATGAHNHGYVSSPSFGSAARGSYGQLGPKGKGGLTLTGELGYEIAWLPSENRSMILGANGPQMVNLPGDAVVWTHEQSEKILKQKSIPAGSHFRAPANGGGGGGGASTSDVVKNAAKDAQKAVTSAAVKVGKVSVWWENIARTTEGVQRKADKAYTQFQKYIKELQATLKTTGTTGKGNKYIKNMSKVIGKNQAQYNKANKSLKRLDKSNKKTTIKYKQGKKPQKSKVKLGSFIQYDKESDSYVINQKKLNKIAKSKKKGGKVKAQAIKDAAEKRINDKLSKRNKAEDAILKAKEALDKFGEELYNTFFAWENELTEIWNLTQKIESIENKGNNLQSYLDLLDAQLDSGSIGNPELVPGALGDNASGLSNYVNEYLHIFQGVIQSQVDAIHTSNELIQQSIVQLKDSLDSTETKTTLNAVKQKLKDKTLNATERLGYEQWQKELESTLSLQNDARKYITTSTNANGTINIDFNADALRQDKLAGNVTGEKYNQIKKYIEDGIMAQSKALSDLYDSTLSKITSLYQQLADLKKEWGEQADTLMSYLEDQQAKEIESIRRVSDAIANSLKSLLDKVKDALDERRKREDNVKTEKSITKKQQRLAMLRADTSGGHQVEIAQLQQEIVDDQLNYQRTLEDQLLDRLQKQADTAQKQREEQISLQEAILQSVDKAAIVNAWMDDPAKYRSEIQEAFYSATKYADMPLAKQEALDDEFTNLMAGLEGHFGQEGTITAAIQSLKDLLPQIQSDMKELVNGIENGGGDGDDGEPDSNPTEPTTQSLTPKQKYKETLKTLAKKGSKITYNDIHSTLAKAGKAAGYTTAQMLPDLANQPGITWEDILRALQNKYNKYRLAYTFTDEAFKKQYDKVYGKGAYKRNYEYAKEHKVEKYARGGLAKYTGPAWLDGTPSKPELVLNSTDTKNFLALRDVLSKAIGSTNSVTNSYGGDATYEININVDHLSNDYDVDRVAERVKKIIVKDSSYRNVTQVRNFR